MEEGRRRHATVRQTVRRLTSWVRRYPDVPVQVVAAGTGIKSSENHSSAIELAVVGRADADQIGELATPNCHPIVVGIDGSKAAMRAALWAVDEAVSREVPVRLLYAIEEGVAPEAEPEDAA